MHDEDLGPGLASVLASVPVPPPRLDVMATVATGRRRVRRRRAAATGGATLLAAVAASATVAAAGALGVLDRGHESFSVSAEASAGASGTTAVQVAPASSIAAADGFGPCRAQLLALPAAVGSTPVQVGAMDPTGRYVVAGTYDYKRDNSPYAIVWHDGSPALIPAGGAYASPQAVNQQGVVVGIGAESLASGATYPWMYRDGRVTVLPAPSGYAARGLVPQYVNAAGDIVGSAVDPTARHTAIVFWPAGNPAGVRIVPGSASSSVAGLTDAGWIAGWAVASVGSAAFVWEPGGLRRALALPSGTTAQVTAVRGTWAFGVLHAAKASTDPRRGSAATAVRWDLRTGQISTLRTPQQGEVRAADPAGDVILGPPAGGGWGLYVHGGEPVTLDNPVAGSDLQPVAVDDSGRVVAGTSLVDGGNGARRPVLWRC